MCSAVCSTRGYCSLEKGMVMKGNNPWVKQSSGPDWMDVMSMMSALEVLHRVSIKFCAGPGPFHGPYVLYTLTALEMGKEASVLGQYAVTVSGEWPCKEHKELTACVFAGLFRLDHILTGQSSDDFTISRS